MAVRQPKYSKEEFARRGHEIYESQIRSQVEADNDGRIVAIDIETEAFEVADDSLTAAKQLLKRCPDAQFFGIRIGRQAVYHVRLMGEQASAKSSSWPDTVLFYQGVADFPAFESYRDELLPVVEQALL